MDPLAAGLRVAFGQLVRRNLRGVWLRGEIPDGAFVWAANHHSWWDAFVAAVLLWERGRDLTVLMDADNLRRYRFLRRLGTRGTNELRAAVRAARDGRVPLIFPEGEMRPAGPLGPLRPGAAWLARSAGVPLVAACTRVVLRGQQRPEAYLDLRPASPDTLGDVLARGLDDLDAALRASDPRAPLAGFQPAFGVGTSWDERLAGRHGKAS